VISASLKEGQPDLGIWLHGDVVMAGEGWSFPPYDATEYKGCIVGRGATDNKGQLCAIFHLLNIFKKLNIQLNYKIALFVGSNEESGKDDLKDFKTRYAPPRLSLVPDASFPVGYGGNGSMLLTFAAKQPFNGISITAGQKDDPSVAKAVFGGNRILTWSPMRHPSNPDPKGNMITKLMNCLLAERAVPTAYRPVLEFFKRLSLDIHGDSLGLNIPSKTMSGTVIVANRIDMVEGCPQVYLRVRYPIELSYETILAAVEAEAQAHGLEIVQANSYMKPYLLDKDWPVVTRLAEIANEITGDNKQPYIVGGGTYAHELPNALAFGMDGSLPPEDFPKGRGSAHGLDESVSLDRLQRAMRIYARALLALNEMEW
jgi:succinyl-diaminopimelate desuccinylase